jgi:hypothetical protein
MHREENGQVENGRRARDTTNKEERLCLVSPAAAASGQQVELNSLPTTDSVAPSFCERLAVKRHCSSHVTAKHPSTLIAGL